MYKNEIVSNAKINSNFFSNRIKVVHYKNYTVKAHDKEICIMIFTFLSHV